MRPVRAAGFFPPYPAIHAVDPFPGTSAAIKRHGTRDIAGDDENDKIVFIFSTSALCIRYKLRAGFLGHRVRGRGRHCTLRDAANTSCACREHDGQKGRLCCPNRDASCGHLLICVLILFWTNSRLKDLDRGITGTVL